jgi:Xaa-Pro aminopeptidase
VNAEQSNNDGEQSSRSGRTFWEDAVTKQGLTLPFDASHLDALMAESKIDVLIVTSKHNIQYLLGGYQYFFHKASDAIGVSRYLPILIYPRGYPGKAAYIGNAMESSEKENGRFWTPTVITKTWDTSQAITLAKEYLQSLDLPVESIGVEFAFLPSDALRDLEAGLPNSVLREVHFPLERLRACKNEAELEKVQEASERVVAAMLATFQQIIPGMSKQDVSAMLQREEQSRDLDFEYCLISAGKGFNRAPSDQRIKAGDIISLDSGGRYDGYIGDLCRMGIVGKADAELEDLLAEIEAVQQAARKPIKAGTLGNEIFASSAAILRESQHRSYIDFVAHGVGIVSHEAPRLTSRSPLPYQGYDADRPLQPGMVLSIETTMLHPKRGFIKLEDTLAVMPDGWVAYGDGGRGWNSAAVGV